MNAVTPAMPDWTKIDTPVKHLGKEIVLPSDPGNMDYDDAINTIARIRDQENQEFDVREVVRAAPWDAAVALYKAMQDIYGVVLSESIKTFFGEIKPDFLCGGSSGLECAKFDPVFARQILDRKARGQMNADRIGDCRLLGRTGAQ